jgi:truncated hemoglobin YjbI
MSLSYENILEVVEAFYAKATTDVMIGYHFRHIEDFNTHFPRIAAFWDIQLNGKTTRPVMKPFDLIGVHKPLKIKIGEVGRWVVLFEQTLSEFRQRDGHHKVEYINWRTKIHYFRDVFLTHPTLFSN